MTEPELTLLFRQPQEDDGAATEGYGRSLEPVREGPPS